MSLKNTIDNQIKESMLNKSKERLVALRAIKSAILLEEKNGGPKKTEDVQILMRLGLNILPTLMRLLRLLNLVRIQCGLKTHLKVGPQLTTSLH